MAIPARGRFAIAVVASLLIPFALGGAAHAATINHNPVSTTIGTTNVTPMWGPQIPKIVYDGPSGWYYATTLDGSGSQYPWVAKIWKSDDGWNWTLVKTLNAWVYQPPSLVLDSGNRLWLDVPCYTGGQCYTGVAPATGGAEQYVYLVRLQFTSRLADGSFDFSTWNDHSVRTSGAERYYRGVSIDPNRRYIWSSYSKAGWGFYFSSYDTWNNTETTNLVGTPGAYQAYLYPRVRLGTAPGEVWLLFNQTYLAGNPVGCTGNACIFGVQLWRSTDGGATFTSANRFMVAAETPDGVNNWCDAADLEIDSSDRPHVLFYKRINGVSHLYYWRGTSGSVTLTGSPTDLGQYDNHSQLMLAPNSPPGSGNEDVVLATNNTSNLTVMRSTDGSSWSTQTFPVSGASTIYSPNLMRNESGSWQVGSGYDFPMLLSESPPGSSAYSILDFLIYYG